MAGRGSFIESFPLFGYDLDDYDELFAEKLELLLALRESERVTWSRQAPRAASTAAASTRARVQDPLPVWVAVGGTPAVGRPRRRARPADGARDHRRHAGALRAVRRAPPPRRRARPGHAARPRSASTRTASSPTPRSRRADESFPAVAAMMDRIGRERGWPPMTRAAVRRRRARCAARTSSAARRRSIEKILFQHEIFEHDRFLVQFSVGHAPAREHHAVDRAVRDRGRAGRPTRARRYRGRAFRRHVTCRTEAQVRGLTVVP